MDSNLLYSYIVILYTLLILTQSLELSKQTKRLDLEPNVIEEFDPQLDLSKWKVMQITIIGLVKYQFC